MGHGIHPQVQYTDFCESSLHTPVAPSSEPTGEPELLESWTSISCVPTWKDFSNLFEKAKESMKAFISTKRKHTDIADTLIGSQRRKLLDLKVRIRQLSGEPTQQSIDYIQRSELSSSLFFHLVASLLCTPTPSLCVGYKSWAQVHKELGWKRRSSLVGSRLTALSN